MPLDPNIILSGKPTVELQDPSKVFAEAQDRAQANQLNQMRMQESGQTMQLNQLNLQKAQQGMQTENALRQLAADPEFKPDDPNSWKTVASVGGLTAGLEFQKAQKERSKTAFESAKLQHEVMQTHFAFAANNTSDTGVNTAIDSAIKSQIVDQQTGEALRQQLLALPEPQRKEAFLNMSMAAKDQAESDRKKFEFTNVSADKKAELATTRRGQDMTAATARQRLAQETATGVLSPDTVDFVAQMVAQGGEMPALGMGSKAAAMRAQILDRAAQIKMNPTAGAPIAAADAAAGVLGAKQNYRAGTTAVKQFNTGPQGNSVRSISVAIDHMDTVSKLGEALQNGDNHAFNAIAQKIGALTGNPAPTNLNAAAKIVGAEVTKAIVANGGGVAERDEAAKTFSTVQSPAQLQGAVNTYKSLLGGQLKGLSQQYETSTGRKDFSSKLSPSAQALTTPATNAPAPAAVPTTDSRGWVLHADKNGTQFYLSPDGKHYSRVK